MPYLTQWNESGIHWIYSGHVTGADILQSNRDVYGDERFYKMRYQLVDFTQAESFDIDERVAREVAYMDTAAARTNPNVKVAIAALQDVIRQLSGIYAQHAERSQWQTEIFESLEEAMEWVGLSR